MDEFDKGASVPRTITLVDTDGDAMDTADFTTIEVRVFNFIHQVIGTYSVADGTVTKIVPTTTGNIFFVVPSTVSAVSRALKYFYRVRTTETDGDYPTGVRTRSFTGWGFKLKTTL